MQWLFLLLCAAATATAGNPSTSYIISDINYDAPACSTSLAGQSNVLGQLSIENDHLAQSLTLTTNFRTMSLQSCRFCELNQSYCGRGLDPQVLRYSPNTGYNIRLVALDSTGHSYASHDASIQTRYVLDAPASAGQLGLSLHELYGQHHTLPRCGQTVSLAIGLVLYYESMDTQPVHRRDLACSVHQWDSQLIQPLWCDAQNNLFPDLSCHSQSLRFYRLDYTLQNCLALQPQREHAFPVLPPPPVTGTVLDQPPALHYYNSFLVYNAPLPAQHQPLCGRDWPQLLYESNLYQYYCGGEANLVSAATNNETRDPYYLMRPWYQMALEWITVKMLESSRQQQYMLYHFVRERHYMSLAQDLLERNCMARNEWGLFLGRQDFYQEIMMALMTLSNYSNRRPQYARLDAVCGELRSYFDRSYGGEEKRPALQYTQFGEHIWFNAWPHRAYSYLVAPNAQEYVGAVLMTTFFVISGLLFVTGLIAVRWNLFRRLARRCRHSAQERVHSAYRKIV
jgi:hypothetical protein